MLTKLEKVIITILEKFIPKKKKAKLNFLRLK